MLSSKRFKSIHPQNPADNAKHKVSRRSVLLAGLAAPIIVPRYVLGGPGNQAPSDKLGIAAVGVGGMGQSYLANCIRKAKPSPGIPLNLSFRSRRDLKDGKK